MTDTFTGETYNALCADAEGYLAGGTPEQARELLLKAISLIGTRPRARSLLSDTCMSMELWPEAREQLEILITLEEGNTRNNFRLGQVLEELGEYQLAADNYTVVLNENPRHHGAIVAIKRIAVRTSESGVNLVDIFATSGGGAEDRGAGQDATLENAGDRIDGMQVFPDLPSDEVFAEAEGADASLTLDRLLDNMGVRSTSDGWKAEDVSKLLDDMKQSDADNLQSMFAGKPSPAEEEQAASIAHQPFTSTSPNLESIFAGTAPVLGKQPEAGKAAPSLEEIFGTSMRAAVPGIIEPEPIAVEIPEPEAITPEVVEPETLEPEVIEPEIVEVEPPAPEILEPEVIEPEVIEPEILEPEVIEPEVIEPEVIEPEVIEPVAIEVETLAPEVLEPEVIEPVAIEVETLAPEVLEPEVIEPVAIEVETLAPEVIEPEVIEAAAAVTAGPDAYVEADEAEPEGTGDILFTTGPDPAVFSSMDALEAIFSAAAASAVITDLREYREAVSPVVPQEPKPAAEPEIAEIQTAIPVPVEEPLGLEVVFGTEAETQEAAAIAEITDQMPVPPAAEETVPVTETTADYYVESWSHETGLVSVTLFSGSLSVRTSLLAAFESSLICEPGSDGICAVRGEGTLMLNCGPVEPLMLQAEEGMTIRTSLLALISAVGELVQSLPVSDLSRLLSGEGMKLLFQTGSPVRKVLLEGGTSALLVRSGSLAAASPGVEISEDSVLSGYLTATGQGRLYLIE